MFRRWAFWRRVQYASIFLVLCAVVLTGFYMKYFYKAPSCFDGVMNGTERGVDCGGNCVRVCTLDIIPLRTVWSESFKIVDGQYNAVAYIENSNRTVGTPKLGYTFKLYDDAGLIVERRGETVLPVNGVYPIFEGRIITGNRIPTQTVIEFDTDTIWLPGTLGNEQFSLVSRDLLDVDRTPRLVAEVRNNDLQEVRNVEIVATIFDSQRRPLTASRTVVEYFQGRTNQNITFTWPEPIARTVRSCEVPSDVVIVLDRSGSMAADGGDPPEPLTSAKRAAQTFVDQLRATDRIGYFSYATLPTSPMEQMLTANKNSVRIAIESTQMGTDGVQYTNMGEAFKLAAEELTSSRHRNDARKVIVFLTDGDVTRPLNPQTGERDIEYASTYARIHADAAKDEDIIIYTIGFGDFFASIDNVLDRDVDLIRDLASDADKSYLAPTVRELENVYREIAEDICEDGATVIDVIPKSNVSFPRYP